MCHHVRLYKYTCHPSTPCAGLGKLRSRSGQGHSPLTTLGGSLVSYIWAVLENLGVVWMQLWVLPTNNNSSVDDGVFDEVILEVGQG